MPASKVLEGNGGRRLWMLLRPPARQETGRLLDAQKALIPRVMHPRLLFRRMVSCGPFDRHAADPGFSFDTALRRLSNATS